MKYQSVHIAWFSDRIQKSHTRDYTSSWKEEDLLMIQSWARSRTRTKLMLRIINWSSSYGIGLESHSYGYHCDVYDNSNNIYTIKKSISISWAFSKQSQLDALSYRKMELLYSFFQEKEDRMDFVALFHESLLLFYYFECFCILNICF